MVPPLPALRRVRRREVLEVCVAEGFGVEGDPVRYVFYLLDAETLEVICRIDTKDVPYPATLEPT